MNEIIKRNYISRLMKELENLNGTSFEQLCHHLLERIVGSKLVYRGTTVSGAPTGYTTDTYSADLALIAEYGTEKNYFSSKNFIKPLSDVDHALKESSNLKFLYLFSSRSATNTELPSLSRAIISKLEVDNREYIKFEIFDGRMIAEKLVELLKYIDYSSELVTHFPALEQIIDEHSMTNSLTAVKPTYLQRDEEITALSILDNQNILYLYGISGIGKTELAISIANQLKEKHVFEVIIWVDGRKVNSVESLKCLEIERVQSKQNVLGLIKRKCVLLIIDGLDNNVDQIIQCLLYENKKRSKVIITSQRNTSIDSLKEKIHVDFLDDNLAKCILNRDVSEKCPLSIFNKIKKAIGCHPLLFEIINKGIKYDGITWRDIEEEASHLPNYEDSNGQSFFKRLLKSHFQTIQNEINVTKWLDGQTFNKKLLQHLIHKSGINKLLTRSFLIEYKGHNYKMHDLVYNCIKMENPIVKDTDEYKAKFITFFSAQAKTKNFHFFNALHVHKNVIKRLVTQNPRNYELINTFLTLDGLSLNDFGNILQRINIDTLLTENQTEQVDPYEVITYIECIENIHRLIKQKNQVEAQAYAAAKIPILNEMLNIPNVDFDLKYEIMHHLGKFYTFTKEYELAKECFLNVIENTDNAYHSKLQLAKFSSGVDIEVAKSYLRDIFLAFEDDPSNVSISIVLAAFNELKKTAFSGLANEFLLNGTLFETAIMYSSVWGYSQPFQVITEAGKMITYKQRDRYIEIVKLLPEESSEMKSEKELFFLGQVFKELGKCYPNNSIDSNSSFSLAKTYFEKIASRNCYYCTMIGECYILLRLYDKAIEVLNQVAKENRTPFWYQRFSQAYQGKNRHEDALAFIEIAIEGIKKPLDEKYRSAFLRQKAQILISLNQKEDALSFYQAAIKCSEDSDFQNEIENEMNALLL